MLSDCTKSKIPTFMSCLLGTWSRSYGLCFQKEAKFGISLHFRRGSSLNTSWLLISRDTSLHSVLLLFEELCNSFTTASTTTTTTATMSGEWITAAYANYKQDTDDFTSWVTRAATQSGWKLQDQTRQGHSGTATIERLEQQAEYIANHQPTVPVPHTILQTARRAVRLRSKCSRWYQSVSNGVQAAAQEKANRGHIYFTSALERMVKVLEPNEDRTRDTPASHPADLPTRADFRVLQDDGTDDDDFEGDAGTLPTAAAVSDREPEPKSSRDEQKKDQDPFTEDFLLQAFCAIEDILNIRKLMNGVWTAFRDGNVDNITAAVVNELAFHMMEELERDALHSEVEYNNK